MEAVCDVHRARFQDQVYFAAMGSSASREGISRRVQNASRSELVDIVQDRSQWRDSLGLVGCHPLYSSDDLNIFRGNLFVF